MTNHSHRDTGGTESAQRAEFLRDVTYRYARGQGFPEEDAKDCAQETVVRMLEAYGPALEPRTPVRHLDSNHRQLLPPPSRPRSVSVYCPASEPKMQLHYRQG
jgi:hypothetical protein